METNTNAKDANVRVIRTMVRSVYDMQDLRIQMGNRITASFKSKLGLTQDGMSERQLAAEEKKILDRLRASYRRITDGVVEEHGDDIKAKKLPTEKKFKGDELISHYSELLLLDNYMTTLKNEERHFKDLEKILRNIPIYTEFLEGIDGIGPAMAAVILSEIDITRAEYPSSLWMLTGLDVVHIGKYTDDQGREKIIRGYDIDQFYADPKNYGLPVLAEGKYSVTFEAVGRSKKDFCLVEREYVNRDGELATRNSITFNPFLKTKLVGVLGTSFLRAGTSLVDGKKVGVARRLELAVSEGFDPDLYNEDTLNDAVILFLKSQGHDVKVERSKYGQIYNDYKNRLNNTPRHADKTDGHKHAMAIRYMVKQFLVDLYKAWRAIEGLVVAPDYAEGVLGKVHGQAKEAGWQHPRYRSVG